MITKNRKYSDYIWVISLFLFNIFVIFVTIYLVFICVSDIHRRYKEHKIKNLDLVSEVIGDYKINSNDNVAILKITEKGFEYLNSENDKIEGYWVLKTDEDKLFLYLYSLEDTCRLCRKSIGVFQLNIEDESLTFIRNNDFQIETNSKFLKYA